MNPSLVRTAKEISERSGRSFTDVLSILRANWTALTGQPVYISAPQTAVTCNTFATESIDDFE